MEVLQLDKTSKQCWGFKRRRITGRLVHDVDICVNGDTDIFFKQVVVEEYDGCSGGIVTVEVVDSNDVLYGGDYYWFVDGIADDTNHTNTYVIDYAFSYGSVLSCKIETNSKMIHLVDIIAGKQMEIVVQFVRCDGKLYCDGPGIPYDANSIANSKLNKWLKDRRELCSK